MDIETDQFINPEATLPYSRESPADTDLLDIVLRSIRDTACDASEIDRRFSLTSFPAHAERIILILYAPGHKRILVSIAKGAGSKPINLSTALQRLLAHPRCKEVASHTFYLQLDFVVAPAVAVDFYDIGMKKSGAQHFEVGIDGLMFEGADRKQHIFLPGDAYIRSVMTMGQVREYLCSAHTEEYLRAARFKRFRSESYLASEKKWRYLYRGYPTVGALTKEKIEQCITLAIGHVCRNQEKDGKFLYYYDASLDSKRDHEHPKRHPQKNPYYNILRHCGGALTCLHFEQYFRNGDTLKNSRLAIDYLIKHAVLQDYDGRQGAYIYSEKKSKLGGSGLALYLLAEYQLTSNDPRYRDWADRIAWHLINQITPTGEFIYYNIYLDKPVSEQENQTHFSFYYPGEAICGLAKYLHLLDTEARKPIFQKLHQALEFLLLVRPTARRDEYTAVPSDGWLMMGIMELWDFAEMRNPLYAEFVFTDAQRMIEHQYKVNDAPYPDYAGAFYYNFGDYPYADGARCEGLLGAYELALKMGNQRQADTIWQSLRLAAWAVMHLVNTQEAIYFAKNPVIALGGIRFKYTRQWFRIDTIQHVVSFYSKLLPYWNRAEKEPHQTQR